MAKKRKKVAKKRRKVVKKKATKKKRTPKPATRKPVRKKSVKKKVAYRKPPKKHRVKKVAYRKPPKKHRVKKVAYRKPPNYETAIRECLQRAKYHAIDKGVDAAETTVRHPDRSVDGEVSFVRPRGEGTRSFLIDVENFFSGFPKGVWISVGVRLDTTSAVIDYIKDPKHGRYDMYQGMVNVQVYGQRISQKGINFAAAREIAQDLERAMRRKITEAFVRLRWDPQDKKMPRVGRRVPKRRRKKSKRRQRR